MSHRIVLVGHCGVDGPRLESAITQLIDDAEVVTANDEESLQEACEQGADLLLFNREITMGFDEDEGLEIMKDVHKRHPKLKVMLVSDLEDAQTAASKAGAVAGFGKADLGSEKFEQRLRQALN